MFDGALRRPDSGDPSSDSKRWSALRNALELAVAEGAFPGCAASVGTSAGSLWSGGFGGLTYEPAAARVSPRTLYDLASLTKVVGTTSVVMALVREEEIALSDPVARLLPEFAGPGKEAVTIEHLLTHSAGLPAWLPLHSEAFGYAEVVARAARAPLEAPPGAREAYSDLGFILLGEVTARAVGKPLRTLERELVWQPLDMRATTRSVAREDLGRTAPTERRPPVLPPGHLQRVCRLQPGAREAPFDPGEARATGGSEGDDLYPAVQGTVHDENAAAASGFTGHAGLFSTLEDLQAFVRELLLARRGESAWLPRALAETFTRRRGRIAGSSRALGWDTFVPGGSGGSRLSGAAFGHTGFTGTSLWLDPDLDLSVILLSNRVHPTRENQRIREVRRQLADLAVDARGGPRRRP